LIISNLHTHTIFCDGKNVAEEYVLKAVEIGMKSLGFSAHAPISIENEWTMKSEVFNLYINEVERLKEKYKDKIEIYTGLEVDYLPDKAWMNTLAFGNKIDYKIGSVHLLLNNENNDYYTTDGPSEKFSNTVMELAKGDIKKCINLYYNEIMNIIKNHTFDIIGHLDVIKKNNSGNIYFNENDLWYREILLNVINTISSSGKILEVNTGGIIRGYIKEPYPSYWILEKCKKLNIPIILTSDAHSANDLIGYFYDVKKELRYIGFTEQMILLNGKWQVVSL
jgi:histidinol-phosphatase (PHP family)